MPALPDADSQHTAGIIPARQARSQRTHDRLLAAGRRLLEARGFDSLTVSDLARAADCSVGTFYGRFADKDAFLRALIADLVGQGRAKVRDLLDDGAHDPVAALVSATVQLYRRRGGLLRAAAHRNVADASVWAPLRDHGRRTADLLVARLARDQGRTLTAAEETRVRFALQVLYGTLNNILLNAPGPLGIDDDGLRPELARVFRLVMALDVESDRI